MNNNSIKLFNKINTWDSYRMIHPFFDQAAEHLLKYLQVPGQGVYIVVGPPSVGKSELLAYVQDRLDDYYHAATVQDTTIIPVISLRAVPTSSKNSNAYWKDIYKRILRELGEEMIDRIQAWETDNNILRNLKDGTEGFRRSTVELLRHRNTKVLFVDNAQFLLQDFPNSNHENQLQNIKELAAESKTAIVLFAPYQILTQDLQDVTLIDLPRYRTGDNSEQTHFQSVLLNLQTKLPLDEGIDLLDNWYAYQEISMGCVGIMKNWIRDALIEKVANSSRKSFDQLMKDVVAKKGYQFTKFRKTVNDGEALRDQWINEGSFLSDFFKEDSKTEELIKKKRPLPGRRIIGREIVGPEA